jgi:beta-mannosidase
MMREQIRLRDGWFVREMEPGQYDARAPAEGEGLGGPEWLTARMPAQVHDVLFAHGLMPDPRIGRNAAECAWVAEKDWVYACRFVTTASAGPRAFLRFLGLDTVAQAWLNGVSLGSFDNMFREHVCDIGEVLQRDGRENDLLIVFQSPWRVLDEIAPDPLPKGIVRHKYLRKSFNDFGSYLGARPHSVKVGVYRDVVLDLPGEAWIEGVCVRTALSDDLCRATVRVLIDTAGAQASAHCTVRGPGGQIVAQGAAEGNRFVCELADPALWWPRTHGESPLYAVTASLSARGEELDTRTVSFGIRDVRLVTADPDTGEGRFAFDVNGRRVFLRGACLSPIEGMTHCWTPDRARRLLDLAEAGNMNVLRIWGGGNIPEEAFYDECDRRGFLVWQDFMFGYGMHPAGDPHYDANCRAEVEGVVRRLRNHPCVFIWVGGNENHMGWDFQFGTEAETGRELFEKTMPEICTRLDPTRPFHPSSPHGGPVPNWPLEGDWHDYTTLTFSHRASVPLYASETGRASAPSLSSMQRFLSPEDLWPEGHDPSIRTPGRPAWPETWQYRSVDGSWDKVGPVERFCDPAGPADLIRVLGTAHGEYLKERVERLRRGCPDGAPDGPRRCWGSMIWRLNDSWPIIYWSAVDYYLQPKIPYYFLRRAYAPVLISFEQTADELNVWVVNDSPEAVAGELRVRRTRFDGRVMAGAEYKVDVAPGEAKRCLSTEGLGAISLRDEFLRATLGDLSATHLLSGERYLHLPSATLSLSLTGDSIEVRTDAFARQVFLSCDGEEGVLFSDNFFDLPAGSTHIVRVAPGVRTIAASALNAAPAEAASAR